MSAEKPTRMPPDSYHDVYEGAACVGLYGDFSVGLCGVCPARERCNALYEDLQFGTLMRSASNGRLAATLTGPWGGHLYELVDGDKPGGGRFMRDGKQWATKDRPKAREWI